MLELLLHGNAAFCTWIEILVGGTNRLPVHPPFYHPPTQSHFQNLQLVEALQVNSPRGDLRKPQAPLPISSHPTPPLAWSSTICWTLSLLTLTHMVCRAYACCNCFLLTLVIAWEEEVMGVFSPLSLIQCRQLFKVLVV